VPSVSQSCWCGCRKKKRSPSIPGRPFQPSIKLRLSGRSSGKLPRIANRLGCWRAASTASALALGSHPGGWITAEYSMLPYSTLTRRPRDISKGKLDGRGVEIQRLIGRSLRAAIDLDLLGQRTLWIDCDVLQADGGTRTAAITGAYVALADAVTYLSAAGKLSDPRPLSCAIAAVSVGVVDGRIRVDLPYDEDSRAEVDMNVVATDTGTLVEVQGTGEGATFPRSTLDKLLDAEALPLARRAGEDLRVHKARIQRGIHARHVLAHQAFQPTLRLRPVKSVPRVADQRMTIDFKPMKELCKAGRDAAVSSSR